jgi:hypothetical protein
LSNVVQSASQIAEIGAALLHRGRADTEQRDIGSVQSSDRIRGCREVPTHDGAPYELVDTRLNNRTSAGSDVVDLHGVNVDAAYFVTS